MDKVKEIEMPEFLFAMSLNAPKTCKWYFDEYVEAIKKHPKLCDKMISK